MSVGAEDIESVKIKIAGEIATSKHPGVAMKKWRLLFGEKQRNVAERMGVSPSVLSDYEQEKRSPGIKFVRRYVESLVNLDLERGGANIRHFSDQNRTRHKAILDIREFTTAVSLDEIVGAIKGEYLWRWKGREPEVFGYTVIDSIAAIRHMDSSEYIQIFGPTSMRVLIFANVKTGRSPLVAVRVYPLKPVAVALHGPASAGQIDELAVELAELSRIPLILSKSYSVNDMIEALRRLD
ncbi:MAG: helix-turn-helix domain-containing protein [Nitrososphaerota archaeon]|nr:helix-turn-helix domain-containing protein [Candidatus Calditenuaceae archaeon]MDW8072966.1 helix-turn-helix domain-containing protein [Nitrososphaerota archaeon]